MSRKDYQAIALAIREQVFQWPERGTHWHMGRAIAEAIAQRMQKDNPGFDREIFLRACGVWAD